VITAVDMAWVAGVMDARGTKYIRGADPAKSRWVMFYREEDAALAERFAPLIGVRTSAGAKAREYVRKGCSEHCPLPHIHTQDQPSNRGVVLEGSRLYVVLRNLNPFLATDFSVLMQAVSCCGYQERVKQSLSELGWDVSHFNDLKSNNRKKVGV